MANVLHEVTDDGLTREHVERRVEDWARRIEALYADIERQLPQPWSARRGHSVAMHEEMMRRFGVPARDLPVLEILHDSRLAATLEPRGLWITGANGRIDLVGHGSHHLLVDVADNFARSDWRMSSLAQRRQREPLDISRLLAALS
jgi:hypothetical protein